VTLPEQHDAEVPVLTQVVGELPAAPVDAEALARELERAVLERLAPEIERVVAQTVREAVAQALGVPRRG
jgi:hypothetical protein